MLDVTGDGPVGRDESVVASSGEKDPPVVGVVSDAESDPLSAKKESNSAMDLSSVALGCGSVDGNGLDFRDKFILDSFA